MKKLLIAILIFILGLVAMALMAQWNFLILPIGSIVGCIVGHRMCKQIDKILKDART